MPDDTQDAGRCSPALRRAALGMLATMALDGCASLPPSAFADAMPAMRAETFFAGRTTSSGVLENRSGAPTRRFQVEGAGEIQADGSLRLVQTVAFEGEAPSTRSWALHRSGAHTYRGSLTDAAGPVRAEAYGNLLHLSYAMRSPPLGHMEQWLYLQPDGQTVVNEATVSILGLVVARLSERITHEVAP